MAAHPANPDYVRFVTETVLRMPAAARLGFQVGRVAPGEVELRQPWRHELTQHDGHLQAGVLASLADLAAGCAAATLLPAGWVNMTVDVTLKILAPASGAAFLAHGRVVNAGLTTTIAAADLWCVPTADGATDLPTAHGGAGLGTDAGAAVSRSRADDALGPRRPAETMCATALITFRNVRRHPSRPSKPQPS